MLDVVQGQQRLIGVLFGRPANSPAAAVVEHRLHRDAERLVEGQHAVIERLAGRDRYLPGLGEGQRAGGIDDDLDMDLPEALENTPVEGPG